jgi:hypothetical protein
MALAWRATFMDEQEPKVVEVLANELVELVLKAYALTPGDNQKKQATATRVLASVLISREDPENPEVQSENHRRSSEAFAWALVDLILKTYRENGGNEQDKKAASTEALAAILAVQGVERGCEPDDVKESMEAQASAAKQSLDIG